MIYYPDTIRHSSREEHMIITIEDNKMIVIWALFIFSSPWYNYYATKNSIVVTDKYLIEDHRIFD